MFKMIEHLCGGPTIFYTDDLETHARTDIHLEIARGEHVAVAGPSGCGKVTLLAVIGLLDSPSDGKYVREGQPTEQLSVAERAKIRNQRIGFIFQVFNFDR